MRVILSVEEHGVTPSANEIAAEIAGKLVAGMLPITGCRTDVRIASKCARSCAKKRGGSVKGPPHGFSQQ